MKTKTFTLDNLRQRYEQRTLLAVADCTLSTDLVGGVPASDEGLRMFAQHQLGLKGKALEEAVTRIKAEEIANRNLQTDEDELVEVSSLGINLIRRDEHGPWLGDWMIKACLKAAASRIGLFVQKRGSKGAMAEFGEVQAHGISLNGDPRHIYPRSPDGKKAAQTEFQHFRGSVSSPQGRRSIVNKSECVPAGSRFSFAFRCQNGALSTEDLADVLACSMVIGLGSCKSFERGKFSIQKLTIANQSKEVSQ